MKNIITILTILISINSLAVGTIKHETCNVVMAKGPYYGTFSNYDLPKDYFDKFREAFERKGYQVVDQMSIGNYLSHPSVYRNASEQRALAFIFRGNYGIIPSSLRGEKSDDHICNMAVELHNKDYPVLKKSLQISKEVILFKNQHRTSLCNKLFRSIKKEIPKCKIR